PMTIKLQLPGQGGRGGGGRGGRGGAKGGAKGGDAPAPLAPAPPPPPPPPVDDGFIHYTAPYDFMLQSNGLSAIGPPWSQLTAIDLNTGTIKWQVPDGTVPSIAEQSNSTTGSFFPRG